MVPTGTTVWPNDVAFDAQDLHRDDPHSLVCFLISPFLPREEFDQVYEVVKLACELCRTTAGVTITCLRADSFHESKTIHDDIWRNIAKADILVVDVTRLNPNVMFEYGVAAALRRPTQVIVIKSEEDKSEHPFDVKPLRYLTYRRSILGNLGASTFFNSLHGSVLEALTPAPYMPPSANTGGKGFTVDLRKGDRPDLILSPGITHRRVMNDGLEFGSYYIYRNSWLLLTPSDYHNVRARIRFRFQNLFSNGLKESEFPFLSLSAQEPTRARQLGWVYRSGWDRWARLADRAEGRPRELS